MPRRHRTDEPGRIHHVTLRGVGAMDIFVDDLDRRRLLRLSATRIAEGGARCLAWAWMGNHVHLVIQTGWRPISEVVHGVAFRYAQFFNWRHTRPGHLFQNRFGSEHVDSADYLLTVIAYVHLNPLRAGIVRSLPALATHPWTSLATILGHRRDPLVSAADTLSIFSADVGAARRALLDLTSSCLDRAKDEPGWHWRDPVAKPAGAGAAPVGAGAQAVGAQAVSAEPAGDDGTIDVQRRVAERSSAIERARAVRGEAQYRAARLRRDGWTVDAVIETVCAVECLAPEALFSGRGSVRVSRARALIAHLSVRELGVTVAEVARGLALGETPARRAVDRGSRIAKSRALTLGAGPLVRT